MFAQLREATYDLDKERQGQAQSKEWRARVANFDRRAGVAGVHPHRYRHDAARRLVAALLGHRRLDTVRVSSRPDEAAPERAAALLETQ